MSKVPVKIFEPSEKMMKLEYPELQDITEFESLDDAELKFVWYYANPTSPYATDSNEARKISQCLKAFGGTLSDEAENRYRSLNFPDKVKTAIDRMSKINVDARSSAKNTVQKVFDNLNRMINIPDSDWAEMTYESKKSYVALSLKVTESLPALVEKMEQGFGVSESGISLFKSDGATIMDRLHMENDDTEL
jgi:hypothetical protein